MVWPNGEALNNPAVIIECATQVAPKEAYASLEDGVLDGGLLMLI